jgi:SAM-dependent methyltransferase
VSGRNPQATPGDTSGAGSSIAGQAPHRGELLLLALVVLTAGAALAFPPRDRVPLFLVVVLGSFALYAGAYLWSRDRLAQLDGRRLVAFLMLTAACLRVAAALAPTSLSDDVFRYVWDGRLLLEGINPYLERPATLWASGQFDDPLFNRLNSPDYYSVYPPLAQAVFGLSTGLADGLGLPADRVLRLVLGLLDVATVGLLVIALRRLGRRPEAAALYAWNPLVFWEVAAGGHSEAAMLPFLVLAVVAATGRRGWGLGLALGLAALAKLTALLLAPVLGWYLVRRMGWRRGLLGAGLAAVLAAGVVAVGYAPLWFDGLVANHRESLELYFGHFIFNSPLFELARGALGYVEGVTPDVSPQIAPVFNGAVLAVLGVATLSVNGRSHRLAGGLLAVALANVLLSSVFHPWYLLLPLLLGVLAGAWSPLVLSAFVALSYLAYDPAVAAVPGRVSPDLMAVQFIPFGLVLALDLFRAALGPILRRRARRKFRAFREFLPPACRLLDIGAGEGFVSACAARAGHRPRLVDVVDDNQTELPHQVYDGRHLPFEADRFDACLLAYVLHHCQSPRTVLEEAVRVSRGLVIVMESVYESRRDLSILTFLDHLANWFRGIPVEPLHFDTQAGWRERFEALGLRVQAERQLGEVVHKHVLFVLRCERPPAGAAV